MTGVAVPPSRERASSRAAPATWAGLAQRVAAPTGGPGLYTGLGRRLARAEPPSAGVYLALRGRADLARYCPRQGPGVAEERLDEDGQTYLVLRSPAGRYMRLSLAEGELWQAMDGTQSVADLATMGFLRFRQLLPVAGLVQGLRQEGFLADAPVGVYRGLRARLADRGVEGLGRRVARALRSHELAIGGVDELAGALHRWGGWALFTPAFLALLALLVLAGVAAFALVSGGGWRTYSLVNADQPGFSLVAFWAALLISFVLHELSHAVAVKHYGRRVPRGGVMLYFGMPAAFVDTSDIWLAGRRARIVVSLAGPLCDLALGSLAALGAALLPVGWAGEAAYRLAAASYLAALCNLNPLLELDGYYMLSDWLGLPNLRRRALDFIGGPLWQKLRLRAALSREERIFSLYGLMAGLYTAVAVALALLFWQQQLARLIGDLWVRGDATSRIFAALIVLIVVVPAALGLLAAAWGLLAAAAAWAARREYGRSPLVVAAALAALAVALAALPLRYGDGVALRLIAPLLWLAALAAQLALRADYRGAAVARALDAFLAVTALELLAQASLLFSGQIQMRIALENLSFTLLLCAGFVALLDLDLRQSPPVDLFASAVLTALAFLVGAMAMWAFHAALPTLSGGVLALLAAPVYSSVVALALLLPMVASFHDSRLLWSWLLLWVGIAAQAAAYLLELLVGEGLTPVALAGAVLAAGLWAAAWCAHAVALRQPAPADLRWPLEPASGEAERLQRAFRRTYAGLYLLLRAYAGERRARALDDRMDVLAATANWELTLDREQARIGAELAGRPLDVQGGRFAEVLRYAVAEIERLAGATFAQRAIRAAYDALPWPEREAADRRCFPDAPWARELSRAFGDARAARLRLLRQVERFAACDDAELGVLAVTLEPRRFSAGALIPRGDPPDLWIVEAGEVAGREGGDVVAELHRGAAFGADGGAGGAGRTYQASVDSDLLFLAAATLAGLLRSAAPNAAEGEALAAAVQALERAPFFHDLPREILRGLAHQAERVRLPARTPVIRQGLPSGRIYVIVEGEAAVVQRLDGERGAEEPDRHGRRVVARLGPTELFGELELLRGIPPVASVVALTPLELLALPHTAVAGLLEAGGAVGRGLEQIGSGRLIDLRS